MHASSLFSLLSAYLWNLEDRTQRLGLYPATTNKAREGSFEASAPHPTPLLSLNFSHRRISPPDLLFNDELGECVNIPSVRTDQLLWVFSVPIM